MKWKVLFSFLKGCPNSVKYSRLFGSIRRVVHVTHGDPKNVKQSWLLDEQEQDEGSKRVTVPNIVVMQFQLGLRIVQSLRIVLGEN